ncbi:MAG TPA: EF-hand domain-containing protein [Chthoniobacterales bacterium]
MKLWFAVSVLACVGLAAAWGQDEKSGEKHGHRRSPEEMMKRLDTNHDGKISLEEWNASPRSKKDPARAEEWFKKMDTNHDGFVTQDELKAHPFGEHHGEHGGGGRHSAPSASPSASVSASP